MRGRSQMLVALTALVALAGCGSSSSSSSSGSGGSSSTTSGASTSTALSTAAFKQSFAAQKAQFRKLGSDLQVTIAHAAGKPDAVLAREFAGLSTRAQAQAVALRTLAAPARYRAETTQLAEDFDAVAKDLHAISLDSTAHNSAGARAATTTLIQHSAALKRVDLALSAQLGLPQTP